MRIYLGVVMALSVLAVNARGDGPAAAGRVCDPVVMRDELATVEPKLHSAHTRADDDAIVISGETSFGRFEIAISEGAAGMGPPIWRDDRRPGQLLLERDGPVVRVVFSELDASFRVPLPILERTKSVVDKCLANRWQARCLAAMREATAHLAASDPRFQQDRWSSARDLISLEAGGGDETFHVSVRAIGHALGAEPAWRFQPIVDKDYTPDKLRMTRGFVVEAPWYGVLALISATGLVAEHRAPSVPPRLQSFVESFEAALDRCLARR